MQLYEQTRSHLICGHWNGSPVEVGMTGLIEKIPRGEKYHTHPYREYFVVLEGSGTLLVDGEPHEVAGGTTVMLEPGEPHRWDEIGPEGIRWVLIKERSEPDSKIVLPEP